MTNRTSRRRMGALAATAAIAIAGWVAFAQHSAGARPPKLEGSASEASTGAISSAEMQALAPVPPIPSPWQPYATKVWAGPTIQFLGRRTGFIVEGQGPKPRVDGRLAAGFPPESWPGTSIAVTQDGGRRWMTTLQVPTGIWSIDIPGPAAAWAVGISSLYRTSDQGRSWRTVGEPKGTHLVEVRFDTKGRGLGIDSAGYAHLSIDAGDTWTTSMSGPYLDACLTQKGSWLAADAKGRIWSVAPSTRGLAFSPTASVTNLLGEAQISLSCGSRIWETIRQPAGDGSAHPAGFLVFVSSGDQGYKVALSSGTLGADTRGEGLASLGTGFTLAAGDTGAAVVAARSILPGRIVVQTRTPGGRVTSTSVLRGPPDLDSLPAFMTSAIQGLAVLPSGFGWLKVDAEIPSGGIQAPDPDHYLSLTYLTSDGGRSWYLLRRLTVRTAGQAGA